MMMKSEWIAFLVVSSLVIGCFEYGGKDKGSTGDSGSPGDVAHCDDGVLNAGETDVDCGGACAPCPTGSLCIGDDDCASGTCGSSYACILDSCDNDTRDEGESGVDCGGDCPACFGEACTENHHCATGYCLRGVCAEPSCSDQVRNGCGLRRARLSAVRGTTAVPGGGGLQDRHLS
jgi:hypothetical protein